MIVVADSSPLISFAILGKLDTLSQTFTGIYIPEAVYNEVSVWNKPYTTELKDFSQSRVRVVQNRLAVAMLSNDLDLGEAEVIVLALENNINDILIDDYKGRRIARLNNLYPIGTIGVLLQAKKLGHINDVKSLLDILISNKIRISQQLYQKALKLAGED